MDWLFFNKDNQCPEVDKTSGGSTVRTLTYYPVAGALRIDSTLYYVLKDHLGSASVVTDAGGNVVGEQRYYPFGEARLTIGALYTDRLFTGQREMAGLGVYHYGARFYSPKLGRFLSADTIVPGYANPQNLNRYSYVNNSPLMYTDPTGHELYENKDKNGECKSNDEMSDLWDSTHGNDDEPGDTLTRDDLNEVQKKAEELAAYYEKAKNRWEWGTGIAVAALINVPGCFAGGVFTGWASCGASIAISGIVIPSAVNIAGELGGGTQSRTASSLAEAIEDVLIASPSEQFTVTIDQDTNYDSSILLPGGSPIGTVVQTSTITIQGSDGYSETIIITDVSFRVLVPPSSIVDSSFAGVLP